VGGEVGLAVGPTVMVMLLALGDADVEFGAAVFDSDEEVGGEVGLAVGPTVMVMLLALGDAAVEFGAGDIMGYTQPSWLTSNIIEGSIPFAMATPRYFSIIASFVSGDLEKIQSPEVGLE